MTLKGATTKYNIVIDKSDVAVKPREARGKKRLNTPSTWYYMGFVGEVGFAIALPIVGGALAGSYLDKQLASYPRATLSLLVLGTVLSLVNFVRLVLDVINKRTY